MRRRFLAACLSVLLAFSSLPLAAVPALAADGDQFDTILKMDSVTPAGFDENSEENPYGHAMNQPFLLNAESELMVYRNKDNGNDVDLGWYDTRKDSGLVLGVSGKTDGFESAGLYAGGDGTATKTLSELYHVESVAFDPTGSGRKDHVAYIGHDANGGAPEDDELVIVVVDTTQENQSATYRFSDAGWMSGVESWLGGNYLAITAGDYTGSGRETLVAHVLTDGDTYGLVELSYNADSNTISLVRDKDKSLLHWKYVSENHGQELDDSHEQQNKLSADLATGDFNGDGIDDLAVVSYLNGGAWDKGWDCAYYFPMLNVAYGESDGDTVLDNQKSGFCNLRRQEREGLQYKLTAPAAPGIAAGDIDGDGVDEIVVAGTKNAFRSKSNSYDAEGAPWSIDGESWVIVTLNAGANGSFALPEDTSGLTTLSEVGSNAWFAGGTGGEGWRSPMDVECVAMNGPGEAEYVFMGGALFDLSTSATERLHTPSVFNEDDDGVGTQIVDEHYVQSVVAGNFDGNKWGYEQVMYVVVMKDRYQNDYYYRVGMIGGAGYDGEGGSVGSQGGTDQTRFFDVLGDFMIQNTGGGYHTNVVLTAMDRDKDGVMARYVGKTYVYADPQVLAVLQMAPYFDEIDIGNDAGATTYTFTRTYEYTTGTSESKSYSIGGAFTAETPVVEVEVEAGYVNSWSKSFESTLTRSISDSFTAKAYDSVVLYRTPVFNYNYELMKKDGSGWVSSEEAGLTVSVPKTPTYVQMSVEDYNNFVDVYNAMMADETGDMYTAMKKLELGYLGQEGNPWGYGKPLDQVSNNTYRLGYNGGETTSASANGTAYTETIEQETGFSFEVSATAGFSFGDFGAKAGVNYSLEEMAGSSTSTTTSSETETSGTVQDLDWQYLRDEYGIPDTVTRSYGFTWGLGKGEVDLGAAGKNALVIGYNVSNVTAPAPPVTELTGRQVNESSVDLSWVDPSVDYRDRVDGYNVYYREPGGEYQKVNDAPLPKDTLEYRVTGLKSNTDYLFSVTTVSGNKESVWSNEVALTTPKGMRTLTFAYDDDEATLSASHLGNVDIQSGDAVPEETIVYVELAPAPGYTITSVTLTQEGEGPEAVSLADGRFNFVIREDTTIEVVTQKVVDKSLVSYEGEVTDADGNVIGTVEGKTESGIPIDPSGAEVYGPVVLVATPADGYVLKEWKVSTTAGENTIEAIGNELTFYPYESEHRITPVFAPLGDPSVTHTVTIAAHAGGQIVVTSEGEVLEPGEGDAITVARGTELTFEAVPDEYYKFIGWTESFEDYGDDTTTVTLRALDDLTVGAAFNAELLYSLEFDAVSEDATGGGTLTATANGAQLTSGEKHVPNTEVDFAATADAGSRLTKWGVAKGTVTTFVAADEGLVTEDDYQLVLESNSSVEAYFRTIETYDLEVPATVEHGSVIVERNGLPVSPDDDALSYGDIITINAEPIDGWILIALEVNGEEFTPGETLLVTGPVTIVPTFIEDKIDAHAWGEPTWTWAADTTSATAHFVCACGEQKDVEATVTSAPDPAPTCEDEGTMLITATVSFEGTDYTDTRTGSQIEALDHAWGAPVWTWVEDGSACEATFTCSNDTSHVEVVTARVSEAVEWEATCTETGSVTHAATLSFDGRDFSTSRTDEIPATGHDIELEGAKNPTEYEKGYTGDQVCAVCDEVLREGEEIDTLPVDAEIMYRLYNRWSGEHFYTSDLEERAELVVSGWLDEGMGWAAPIDGTPVYRLYNPWAEGGDHHYTTSAEECDALAEQGWVKEGIGWHSAPAGSEVSIAVYRQYNPYAVTGTHNYTTSAEERDALVEVGWLDEGLAWYGVRLK